MALTNNHSADSQIHPTTAAPGPFGLCSHLNPFPVLILTKLCQGGEQDHQYENSKKSRLMFFVHSELRKNTQGHS